MSFINPSGTFENEANGGPITVIAPLTGTTFIMHPGMEDLYVNPAGTLAALTIQLVPAEGGGRELDIFFKTAITALTVLDRLGNAITGAPTAATAGLSITMRHVNKTIGWVRWR